MPFAQQRTLSTTIKSMMISQGWIEENWRWQRLDGFMTWSVLSIVCVEIFTVLEVRVESRLNSGVYSNHALAMPQLPSDHVYAALMITESANRLTRRHLSRLVQNEYVQNPGPPQTRNSLPLEIWTTMKGFLWSGIDEKFQSQIDHYQPSLVNPEKLR